MILDECNKYWNNKFKTLSKELFIKQLLISETWTTVTTDPIVFCFWMFSKDFEGSSGWIGMIPMIVFARMLFRKSRVRTNSTLKS